MCRPGRRPAGAMNVSELRWNPLLGEWVISAAQRQDRTFFPPPDSCPLCPTRPGGFQSEIPAPDYDIVCFENRFPSLERNPPAPAIGGTELYPVRAAQGICEVVVYTPNHNSTLAAEPASRIEKLIRAGPADEIRKLFRKLYNREPRLFRAPGRVNLIGEHVDYNEGFVMPMAIERETLVAGAARNDRLVRVHSASCKDTAEFNLDEPPHPRGWQSYVEGVARVLESRGLRLRGADLAIDSDLPIGAGLSSSSALEISTGLALLSISSLTLDPVQLALAGQKAEHEYAHVNCGIMDQLIAVLGRQNTALLIDCRSLETTYIPLDASQMAVVICDTRVKHQLAASEYNARRGECERAVELLSQAIPGLHSLRDLTTEDFLQFQNVLPDTLRARCRHVLGENQRTLAAAEALRLGDLRTVGRLLFLSHDSLRYDYQVSSPELDLLVEIADSLDGVFGARMTGGGFGGCTVTLLRPDAVPRFRAAAVDGYRAAYGREPGIYPTVAANGAGELP